MGYNVDISVNLLKYTNFSEIENTIQNAAKLYDCNNIYLINEEDGTIKIPRYHCVYVINFLDNNFDNFIKFLKFIKQQKLSYIECIYDDNIYKLLYASTFYLTTVDKNTSNKYKQFIKERKFTLNESILLQEFM